MLGRYHGCKEANTYANNFKTSYIWGYLLKKLKNETLKEELGICQVWTPIEDNVGDQTTVSAE